MQTLPDLRFDLHKVPSALAQRILLFRLLLATGARLRWMMDRRLAGVGLTTQQAMLLTILKGSTDEPQPLGVLADRLAVSHQNLRQLVDALARKGLVLVRSDHSDRRVKRVSLTPSAQRKFSRRNAADDAEVASWFAALDDETVKATSTLLESQLLRWSGAQ